MPDSRTFSRTSSGVCLLLGPVLLAAQAAVDPAWAVDPTVFRLEVAAAPDRFALAGMLAPIAAFVFIVGLVGAIHLLRTRLVNLAQVGCGLVVFAMTFFSTYYAVYVIESVSTRPAFDQAQMQTMFEQAQYSPFALLFPIAVWGGLFLGLVTTSVGLFLRRPTVPIWVPAALLASFALLLVETQLFSVAGFLLASVGFGWLGLRILRTSDDEWERWQVLPERVAGQESARGRSRGVGRRVDAGS